MFISLEGTEGVGKSTLNLRLQNYLASKGIEYLVTREPGGTPFAERIRGLLLTNDVKEVVHCDTEMLLMFASRAQHINEKILPALRQNLTVLTDRFVDSGFAYQVCGRGMAVEKYEALVKQFVPIMPDITFWLDAPVNVGMQRIKNRNELDRIEQEKQEFFERIRAGYGFLCDKEPNRIIRIDATQSEDQVYLDAVKHIESLLNK